MAEEPARVRAVLVTELPCRSHHSCGRECLWHADRVGLAYLAADPWAVGVNAVGLVWMISRNVLAAAVRGAPTPSPAAANVEIVGGDVEVRMRLRADGAWLCVWLPRDAVARFLDTSYRLVALGGERIDWAREAPHLTGS
jgi:hypothetical protein